MLQSDVLVIGAGIAGLVAAAHLVKEGLTVRVLEKAVTVGGSAGYYRRRGLSFPTGATLAFGLEEGGVLQQVLAQVGVHPPAHSLAHPMDVVLPDRTMPIWQDPTRFESELARVFYERSETVVRAWQELCTVADSVLGVSSARPSLPIRRIVDLGQLPAFAFCHPLQTASVVRHRLHTVEHWLRAHRLDDYQPFVAYLNAQLVDSVQTDVQHAALLPASVALTIYRKGSFALAGGFGALAELLAAKIREGGGEIRTACAVERVDFADEGDGFAVQTRKGSYSARYLIDATSAPLSTLSQLRTKPTPVLHGHEPEQTWGALRMDAIYQADFSQQGISQEGIFQEGISQEDISQEDISQEGISQEGIFQQGISQQSITMQGSLPFSYQVVPSREHAALFEDLQGAVYITVHPAQPFGRDLALSPPGYPVTVSVHTKAETWLELREEAYQIRKRLVQDALIAECERVLPDARTRLAFLSVGTPRTYRTYVGKEKVGGSALTVERAIRRPIGYRTSIPHYYRAGESTFPGPGTLSAALSGYFAARGLLADAPALRPRRSVGVR